MKLTDIDLSSLAEVAAAVTLLEHVHRELATGGTPLPSLPPAAQEFVVNPAPSLAQVMQGAPNWSREQPCGLFVAKGADVVAQSQRAAEVMSHASQAVALQREFREMDAALAADAEKLRGLGVDPITAQPLPERHAPHMQPGCEPAVPMDAASVFGGAPAQSAAPLPQSAPASADAAASPTAPVAPLASGPTSQASALPALAPLPAPSAAAPAAPVAQPSLAGGVELDTDGLPWDERIHAGTKRKNDDGRWTKKRGLNDPALVTRVVEQLRAQIAAGGVTTQSAAPLPLSAPAPSTPPLAALPTTSGLASLAAPTPPALPSHQPLAVPQQSSGAPAPTTYLDFMTAATVEVQSGRVPIEAFGEVCKSLGGATALSTNPELIPIAWATLKDRYPGML